MKIATIVVGAYTFGYAGDTSLAARGILQRCWSIQRSTQTSLQQTVTLWGLTSTALAGVMYGICPDNSVNVMVPAVTGGLVLVALLRLGHRMPLSPVTYTKFLCFLSGSTLTWIGSGGAIWQGARAAGAYGIISGGGGMVLGGMLSVCLPTESEERRMLLHDHSLPEAV